jgi:hypothetical protein
MRAESIVILEQVTVTNDSASHDFSEEQEQHFARHGQLVEASR